MKFLVHLLFAFTGCLAVWAESPKVAILSDDPEGRTLVDLVLAQASERFAFVERQQIVKIEQESRLTPEFQREKTARNLKIAGADLFAVVDRNPGGQLQLTVFESANGFRLRQRLLAGDNDRAVTEIIANMGAAATMLDQPEQIRMISLAAVRDNLLFPPARPVAPEAQKILDMINSAPGVVILERDYLIELLKEKLLSGKWQHAVTASEICHVEFNPGSEAQNFTVAVYLTDAADQKTFHFESEEGDLQYFDKLSAAFAASLQTSRRECVFDSVTEAARFAREGAIARSNHDDTGAIKKYFAASVLDPAVNQYLIKVQVSRYDEVTYPYSKLCLDRMMGQPELLSDGEVREALEDMVRSIDRSRDALGADNQTGWRQWLEDHRETYFVYASRGESATDEKLNRFQKIRPEFYWQKNEFAVAKEHAAAELLSALRTLPVFADTPQAQRANAEFDRQLVRSAPHFFALQGLMAPSVRQVWTRDYAGALQSLGRPAPAALALLLRVNALMGQPEYTDSEATAMLTEYFIICKQNRIADAGEVLMSWPELKHLAGLDKQAKEIYRRIYR